MTPRRYFIRFEKSDGSEVAIWKTNRYEYEQRQALQLANMPLVGESYSFDNQGPEPSIKGNGSEAVRFLNLGDEDDIDIDTNGGNANALDPVIIFKGPATANISLINNSALLPGTSTPYKIESTRVLAASTDWLKFDGRRNEVMRSTNSGATWVDDSGNAVLQAGQLRMMLFKPGANSLVVDNVSGDIEVIFTEEWH
jgi:hypothetical protein